MTAPSTTPLRLGWFSTGRGEGSRNLLRAVQEAIRAGDLRARIEFVFMNREQGEADGSDAYIQLVRSYGLPLAAASFRAYRRAWTGAPDAWRVAYDREVARLIAPYRVDLCILAGYLLILGPELVRQHSFVNLHPAAPGGPKGIWQEVIWQLIEQKAPRSGITIFLCTPEVDAGPTVTYCTYPIRGGEFDPLWRAVEGRSVADMKANEGEELPLFKLIRQHGMRRETPLIVETLRAFAEGRARIAGERVVDGAGKPAAGHDLTAFVERTKGGGRFA